MSTHLSQYVAACRVDDNLRAAAAARAVPRTAHRRLSLTPIARLHRFHQLTTRPR